MLCCRKTSQSDMQPHHILIFTLMRAWFLETSWKRTWMLLVWPARIQSSDEMALMFWVCMPRGRTTHLIGDMEVTCHQFLRSWHDAMSSHGVEIRWVTFLYVVGFVLLHLLIMLGWDDKVTDASLESIIGDIVTRKCQNDLAHGKWCTNLWHVDQC